MAVPTLTAPGLPVQAICWRYCLCVEALHDMPQGARGITPHPQDSQATESQRSVSGESVESQGESRRHERRRDAKQKEKATGRTGGQRHNAMPVAGIRVVPQGPNQAQLHNYYQPSPAAGMSHSSQRRVITTNRTAGVAGTRSANLNCSAPVFASAGER